MTERLAAYALLAALALPPSAAAQESAPARRQFFEKSESPLPADTYCKIDGFPLLNAEYGDWLRRYHGDQFIQGYVTARLLRNAAKALGVEAPPAEVDAAVNKMVEERTLSAYRGNRDLFIERELTNFGKTLDQFKVEKSWEAESDILLRRVLQKRRLTTDADVEREFKRLYGSSGREFRLSAILVEIDPPSITSHKSAEEIVRINAKAVDDAHAKAVQIVKKLQSGAIDFSSAALAYSDDFLSKRKGGDIGEYMAHPPMFGEEFDALLHRSKPGQILGPVRTQSGYVIAQITRETVHELKAERDKIRKQLTDREPTPEERTEFLNQLIMTSRLIR